MNFLRTIFSIVRSNLHRAFALERDESPKNHARTIFVVSVLGLPLLPLMKWLEPVVVVVLFWVWVEVILLGLPLLPIMQLLEPVVVVVLVLVEVILLGLPLLPLMQRLEPVVVVVLVLVEVILLGLTLGSVIMPGRGFSFGFG
jgi:hypothetical protein